ncbi:MAG: hypothetical protein CMD48_06400 [Gammaproteobacteria bacterium]|jgi:uncharacterized membrane protein YecN with MAPEG domain|nr:hypothetical protein [Gammaproteobacteria bacterium]|tara:strand:+ start:1212 stop:1622 length:411 start_codon:yes stop_codon:yes gene_type:complete
MLTLFYASSLTILALVLSFLTGRQRFKTETNLGLGDDFGMLQITRAHGNLIENALFFLILMFLLETVAEVSIVSLMVLGDIFLLARIAHAYGITRPEAKSIFRMLGTLGSIIVLSVQSIWGLIIALSWLSNNNWGF